MDTKTILIVEDEKPLMSAIVRKLQRDGIQLVSVSNMDDALASIKGTEKIDAIWLDHYLLGKGSGLDLVHYLKAGSEYEKNIPIFVVSNTASEEKQQQYVESGVTKFYVRSDHTLEEVVTEVLREVQYAK